MPRIPRLLSTKDLSIAKKFALPTMVYLLSLIVIALSVYLFIADLRQHNDIIRDVTTQKAILSKLEANLAQVNDGLTHLLFLNSRDYDGFLLAKAEDFQAALVQFREISERRDFITDKSLTDEIEPHLEGMRIQLVKIVSLSINQEFETSKQVYQEDYLHNVRLVRRFLEEALYGKTDAIEALVKESQSHELMFSLVFLVQIGLTMLISYGVYRLISRQLITPINQIQEVSSLVVEHYSDSNSDSDSDSDGGRYELTMSLNNLKSITSRDEVGSLARQFAIMVETIDKGTLIAAQKAAIEDLYIDLKIKSNEIEQSHQKLIISNEQLEHSAKLSTLGEMSAGIAHEINQPLGVIKLYSDTILILIKGHSEKADKMLAKILTQIDRITKIINHLKLFSRDDTVIEKENTEVDWLIDQSLVLLTHQFKQKSIKLSVNIETEGLSIECNSIQLLQVITNLLNNARDAIVEFHENHPESELEKRIDIHTFTTEDRIFIEITDTGGGIPDEVKQKIFQPFYTTKDVGKGTGLGLSICYGIVEEHNGSLNCTTEVGVGSTFSINLPYSRQENLNEGIAHA